MHFQNLGKFFKFSRLRALSMVNCIKYGTNDAKEIMLLRYGFDFEDMDWLKEKIQSINDEEIVFNSSISEIELNKKDIIERYYN